jgi:hypothetical protein
MSGPSPTLIYNWLFTVVEHFIKLIYCYMIAVAEQCLKARVT